MVLQGSVPELARKVLGTAYQISLEAEGDEERIRGSLQALRGVEKVHALDGRGYALEARQDLRPEVAQAVLAAGGRLYKLDVELQSLDVIYSRYFEEVENGN
jgi:ABC-2 type transport system ATP-binding protein